MLLEHTHRWGHCLTLCMAKGPAPLHAGMGPHTHGGGSHAPMWHLHLITAIPVSARCRWLSCHLARPGWSSVCRARRTWLTWTTGPTRRGVRRIKTPASSRSLPTATLVGTPPWPGSLTLCSFSSSLSTHPLLLSLSLVSVCVSDLYLPGLVYLSLVFFLYFILSYLLLAILPGSVSLLCGTSFGCPFPGVSSYPARPP